MRTSVSPWRKAARKKKERSDANSKYSNESKMRSEAQAPFRVARMFLFGAFGRAWQMSAAS